jgi:heme-degrading monooxygenase HmoA
MMRGLRFQLLLAAALACATAINVVGALAHPRIARVWRGYVATKNADSYREYLERQGVTELRAIQGNRGVEMWRRGDGDRTEFVVVSYWDSREGIQNFTGPDWEKVKPLPDDAKYLIEPAASVTHYDIVGGDTPRKR